MKYLIPMDDYGVFADSNYVAMVDSRSIADVFEKGHRTIFHTIERIINDPSFSKGFISKNFILIRRDKRRSYYVMTRDGFSTLSTRLSWGPVVDTVKSEYIKHFNDMEELICCIQSLREMFHNLSDAIKSIHDDSVKPHYINDEIDMLFTIVLGMSASQYREQNHIPAHKTIREHMTDHENALFDTLQLFDIGFVVAVPDINQRRQMLEYQAIKWREKDTK